MIVYRQARLDDLDPISRFTDWWISGRGKARNVPGAVNDCFITKPQHQKYIRRYETLIAFRGVSIVGWAVKGHNEVLIHLLISGPYRGQGIGKAMISILRPRIIRSKKDQSTGNPVEFYKKLGYQIVRTEQSKASFSIDQSKPNRPENIDVFVLVERPSFTKIEVSEKCT